jgi:hypothetical protein
MHQVRPERSLRPAALHLWSRCLQGGFQCVREDPKPRKIHTGPKKDAFAPKGTVRYQANNLPLATPNLYPVPMSSIAPFNLNFPSPGRSTAQDLTDILTPPSHSGPPPEPSTGIDFFSALDFQNILVDSLPEPLPVPVPDLGLPIAGPSSLLFSPSSRSETENLLINFFTDYVLPSWASIYPPNIARRMIERSSEISEMHSLNLISRQAAAACYIAAYRERGGKGKYHYNAFHQNALSGKLAHIPVDPQGFFYKALTELEAAQYDQSMTVEGCLWSAGDLHIAAMAYFDSKVVLRVKACADRIISATFGQNPLIDLATLQGVPTMCLRWYSSVAFSHTSCSAT